MDKRDKYLHKNYIQENSLMQEGIKDLKNLLVFIRGSLKERVHRNLLLTEQRSGKKFDSLWEGILVIL